MQGEYPYYGPTGILDYLDSYRVEGKYALIGEDGDHFLKYDSKPMTLLVEGKFNVNNHAHLVCGCDKCLTEWFFHFFRHADIFPYLTRQGAGRFKLNKASLEQLPILLPPLSEQRAIAAILSTWDEAITLTGRLIAALRQRKQGLMQRLLTGEVRFPEFEGEWHWGFLGKIASVRRGASPRPIHDPQWFSETGRGWIRIADINASPTRFLEETTQYLSLLGEEKSVRVEVGELILSIAATIGVPKIVKIPACIHDGFVLIDGYEGQLDTNFLYYFLSSLTDRLAGGGQPGTQKNINSELVREIDVPQISLTEQKKIASVLIIVDEHIYRLGQILEALKQQKKGLMQRLLTGEIRVQVDE